MHAILQTFPWTSALQLLRLSNLRTALIGEWLGAGSTCEHVSVYNVIPEPSRNRVKWLGFLKSRGAQIAKKSS